MGLHCLLKRDQSYPVLAFFWSFREKSRFFIGWFRVVLLNLLVHEVIQLSVFTSLSLAITRLPRWQCIIWSATFSFILLVIDLINLGMSSSPICISRQQLRSYQSFLYCFNMLLCIPTRRQNHILLLLGISVSSLLWFAHICNLSGK